MNILTEMRVEANKMEAKTLKKIFSVVFIDFTSWKSDQNVFPGNRHKINNYGLDGLLQQAKVSITKVFDVRTT